MEKELFLLGSQFGRHSPSQGGHAGGRGSSYGGRGVWPVTSHQQTGTGSKGLRWGGDNLPGLHSGACICKLCPVSERLYSVDLVFKCRSLGAGAEADLLTYLYNEPKC